MKNSSKAKAGFAKTATTKPAPPTQAKRGNKDNIKHLFKGNRKLNLFFLTKKAESRRDYNYLVAMVLACGEEDARKAFRKEYGKAADKLATRMYDDAMTKAVMRLRELRGKEEMTAGVVFQLGGMEYDRRYNNGIC